MNQSGHILVVDDQRTNRVKLTLGLKQQGHTSEAAENGQQALDMLRTQSFDLVLLDILMPEMDGYQVLAHMKNDGALRDIPVIVISALDEMESIVKGIELGAEDYLSKSFDPVLLRARINACLEKKRLRDREQLYLKGLERELDIGRQIQASFLPDKLPQLPGWEIAAYFQAAREVAGDFYDAFTLWPEKKIGLVIGDVCDKGVGAALFMTLFRSLIRAVSNLNYFMGRGDLPSAILNHSDKPRQILPDGSDNIKSTVILINNYITQIHKESGMFASLFFGLLDPASGSLIYLNAGHEPPVILSMNGVKAHLTRTGPVVGIFPGIDFKIQEVYLEPGDILLAFTDGVTEAMDPDKEIFSTERLLALLEQPTLSARALLDRIEANLQTHIAEANQFDDITMLAVRRMPTPAE